MVCKLRYLPCGPSASTDRAQTLVRRENGLPARGKYTQVVQVDRTRAGRVLIGCERGVYLTENGAALWRQVLPTKEMVLDVLHLGELGAQRGHRCTAFCEQGEGRRRGWAARACILQKPGQRPGRRQGRDRAEVPHLGRVVRDERREARPRRLKHGNPVLVDAQRLVRLGQQESPYTHL